MIPSNPNLEKSDMDGGTESFFINSNLEQW